MPTITYIHSNGERTDVTVEEQMTVMEGATMNMVEGIEGRCGGMCSCATCHCYVEGEWAAHFSPPEQPELDMLDTASHRKETSRLGCQLVLSDLMEGLEVHLPPEQTP